MASSYGWTVGEIDALHFDDLELLIADAAEAPKPTFADMRQLLTHVRAGT